MPVISAIKDGKRLYDIEIDECQCGKGPELVVEAVHQHGEDENRRAAEDRFRDKFGPFWRRGAKKGGRCKLDQHSAIGPRNLCKPPSTRHLKARRCSESDPYQ